DATAGEAQAVGPRQEDRAYTARRRLSRLRAVCGSVPRRRHHPGKDELMHGTRTDAPTLARVRAWIEDARQVVALTGAGISTDSGIPDFRGPQGLWTRDPKAERLSSIECYVSDPDVRKASWKSRLAHPAWTARPN